MSDRSSRGGHGAECAGTPTCMQRRGGHPEETRSVAPLALYLMHAVRSTAAASCCISSCLCTICHQQQPPQQPARTSSTATRKDACCCLRAAGQGVARRAALPTGAACHRPAQHLSAPLPAHMVQGSSAARTGHPLRNRQQQRRPLPAPLAPPSTAALAAASVPLGTGARAQRRCRWARARAT